MKMKKEILYIMSDELKQKYTHLELYSTEYATVLIETFVSGKIATALDEYGFYGVYTYTNHFIKIRNR